MPGDGAVEDEPSEVVVVGDVKAGLHVAPAGMTPIWGTTTLVEGREGSGEGGAARGRDRREATAEVADADVIVAGRDDRCRVERDAVGVGDIDVGDGPGERRLRRRDQTVGGDGDPRGGVDAAT